MDFLWNDEPVSGMAFRCRVARDPETSVCFDNFDRATAFALCRPFVTPAIQSVQNAYAFDSGDAKVWRVNGGFLVELPRSVCNAAIGVRRRLKRKTYSSKSRGKYFGLTPW